MGKKYIIKDGKEVEITEGSDISDLIRKTAEASPISFGQIVEYKVGSETRIGKVTGATKSGLIVISKVVNKSRAGFQFSSTDTDTVKKNEITRRLS